MNWWIVTLIVFAIVIVLLIILLLVVKFNKKVDVDASVADKGSVSLKIENDIPLPQKLAELDKIAENRDICGESIQYDFIKHYAISTIESHLLLSKMFYDIQYSEDISDKIYLKLLKKVESENIRDLNIKMIVIQKFYKEYAKRLHENIDKYILSIKNDFDDTIKLRNNLDALIHLFEDDSFINDTIQDFKSRGIKVTLVDGTTFASTADNFDDNVLQQYKYKIKKNSPELVNRLSVAKTQLLVTDNKMIKVLSAMRCIEFVFDAIVMHLYHIYFECKPAVIGISKGV